MIKIYKYTNTQSGNIEYSADGEKCEKYDYPNGYVRKECITLHDEKYLQVQSKLCKHGETPDTCTNSPTDYQCAIDATLAQPEQKPVHTAQTSIVFYNGNSTSKESEVLRITKDGITVNPAFKPDEAAAAVLRALDSQIKNLMTQPEQEPLTLMNNLALIIAGDAMGYRELVWNLSGKVMAVAMSAELVKGQANRVQVTAEAMSNLRKFVEEEVTRRLAFHNKLFDAHTTAAWKLNTNPTWRTFVGLTKEKISDHQCRRLLYGFMLDFNAVGFEQAGRNLHRAIKEATNDVKE